MDLGWLGKKTASRGNLVFPPVIRYFNYFESRFWPHMSIDVVHSQSPRKAVSKLCQLDLSPDLICRFECQIIIIIRAAKLCERIFAVRSDGGLSISFVTPICHVSIFAPVVHLSPTVVSTRLFVISWSFLMRISMPIPLVRNNNLMRLIEGKQRSESPVLGTATQLCLVYEALLP